MGPHLGPQLGPRGHNNFLSGDHSRKAMGPQLGPLGPQLGPRGDNNFLSGDQFRKAYAKGKNPNSKAGLGKKKRKINKN